MNKMITYTQMNKMHTWGRNSRRDVCARKRRRRGPVRRGRTAVYGWRLRDNNEAKLEEEICVFCAYRRAQIEAEGW